MKIIVIGAAGLIGTKTVERLRKNGHDVVPASRSSGVNTLTGEGLAAALKGLTWFSMCPTPRYSKLKRNEFL